MHDLQLAEALGLGGLGADALKVLLVGVLRDGPGAMVELTPSLRRAANQPPMDPTAEVLQTAAASAVVEIASQLEAASLAAQDEAAKAAKQAEEGAAEGEAGRNAASQALRDVQGHAASARAGEPGGEKGLLEATVTMEAAIDVATGGAINFPLLSLYLRSV